jgi:hypothetical protein
LILPFPYDDNRRSLASGLDSREANGAAFNMRVKIIP